MNNVNINTKAQRHKTMNTKQTINAFLTLPLRGSWWGLFILLFFIFCSNNSTIEIKETSLSRIDSMPNHPSPYKILDWHDKAMNFDAIIFDHSATGEYQPFIWLDSAGRNISQTTFGLYTVIGDVRQGPKVNNGEFHEAINSMGALLSAGLIGIDKTNQNGFNYVEMVQNYFNSDNGWNIMMNNTCSEVALLGGGYGRDWWYDVFPNVLYYALCNVFPDVNRADSLQHIIAEQFFKADSVLNGNYDYSYFDYSQMKGMRNHIVYQQDAAAGHAFVLLSAYQKYNDERYYNGAVSALNALFSQKESRFYEVLMPFGAYTAARLNAEHGTNYDINQILKWTFDGCQAKDGRYGWGIINDTWGDFDVSGIQGSLTHDGGYGFLMNTFDMAWPLVPMVRYEPQYACAIGKWMLNAANAARLFYPYEVPDKNQWLPQKKAITKNVIAYEGLKKTDVYDKEELKEESPVALGDGPHWVVGQPNISMFSIYGSAHSGIFGAIIKKTNVEQIIQLDCLATDFYRAKSYPTFLYYNPYEEEKIVEYFNEEAEVDLYDALTHTTVAKNVSSKGKFTIQGNKARLIVAIPSGSKIKKHENKYFANDIAIAYQ